MKNLADYRNGKSPKQVYLFAKNKAKTLNNKQMIRLFADENFDY